MRRIFTGWMFAASPGLHAVEHPIYDIWLTDCKSARRGCRASGAGADAGRCAAAAQPPAQPKQKQRATAAAQQQTQGFPPFR